MSIVIDCNENILRAFPMLSTPAWQFMCTGCVFQALQALNRPVRCKEIREWFNDNVGFPREGFCSWAHDVENCKKCKTCHFNEDYSKVLMKESIAYYSLV